MEYFGGLSDLISPRDIVVGTAPDSLLTLVSQDLPEDIFDHDEDEETDEDGGGSDLHAADAIDAVMDSNNGDINLASVIDDLDASFVDALAESDDIDPGSPFSSIGDGSISASNSPSSGPGSDTNESPIFSDEFSSGVSGSSGEYCEVPFFSDQIDVKEVVVGGGSEVKAEVKEENVDDLGIAIEGSAVKGILNKSSNVIIPPTVYSVLEPKWEPKPVTHGVRREEIVPKIRHTSAESYESNNYSDCSETMSPPPALPGTMSLDDLEEEEMEETEEAPSPCSTSTTIKRPRMSYAQLIAEALMNSDTRRLTLNDIYVHINSRHPYYSLKGGKGWQNAVRHNLTLNKSFVKVPRPANEGRGSWWELEAGAEKGIFKRLLRQHYMYKVALDGHHPKSPVPSSSAHLGSPASMSSSALSSAAYSKQLTTAAYSVSSKGRSDATSTSGHHPTLSAVRSATVATSSSSHHKSSQAVKAVKAVRAVPATSKSLPSTSNSSSNSSKPQIKIIKSIPLVNSQSKNSTSTASSNSSSNSSSNKPTIIYVTLPRHLFK